MIATNRLNSTEPRPPNDDAERAVLGSVLRLNSVLADVQRYLTAESFRTDAHQRIFRAFLALADKSQPIDRVTVAERLIATRQANDIGGLAYLQDLFDATPTAANAEYYARIVRDEWLRQKINYELTEVLNSLYEGDVESVLEDAERRILALARHGGEVRIVPIADAVNRALVRADQAALPGASQLTGVGTGFVGLDQLTGGLQGSELIILAARPGCGKTALAGNITVNAALRGETVLFASLEQSEAELLDRMLCSLASVNGQSLRQRLLTPQDKERIYSAAVPLRETQLWLNFAPHQSLRSIAADARRLHARHGLKLLVVDYLQLVRPRDLRLPRHEQLGEISRGLKLLAKELNVPVLALAQLNRNAEERALPRLSDLKGSGDIEQDADVVMMLHRSLDNKEAKTSHVDVIIGKQRNGPVGDVALTFVGEYTRFEDYLPGADFGNHH